MKIRMRISDLFVLLGEVKPNPQLIQQARRSCKNALLPAHKACHKMLLQRYGITSCDVCRISLAIRSGKFKIIVKENGGEAS